jgi:hypothetical protein
MAQTVLYGIGRPAEQSELAHKGNQLYLLGRCEGLHRDMGECTRLVHAVEATAEGGRFDTTRTGEFLLT